MLPPGVEMIVGMIQDPSFGPVVACGTGGVLVDVLADTAFRLHPLTASDARSMVNDLRGARLLRGYRGAPAVDEDGLRQVLLRVSAAGQPPRRRSRSSTSIRSSSPTAGAVVADARLRIDNDQRPRSGRRVEY